MPLLITTKLEAGVIIFDLAGRLSFLEVALQHRVNEQLEAGQRVFVLNLANVPYIDSFGLGQLIAIWTSIQQKSGQMTLLGSTNHVRKLFEITKLDTIFNLSAQSA